MPWFRQTARPRPVLRTRLRLEQLDYRAVPSSLSGGGDGENSHSGHSYGVDFVLGKPEIVDFNAATAGPGLFQFTGRLQGVAVLGGHTITFGGGIPGLAGQTATTAADGTFTIAAPVSAAGTATAQTTVAGVTSNLATCYVDPSV